MYLLTIYIDYVILQLGDHWIRYNAPATNEQIQEFMDRCIDAGHVLTVSDQRR